MNVPDNLKYTNDHEWVKIDNDIAIVGITDFAQSELGDIVYVEIDTKGDLIEKDSVFGTVEAVKTVSDLFMPLTGEILEINRKLNKIKVKSINMIKKHLKPTKENKGGIISKESFIHNSNVKNIDQIKKVKKIKGTK